MRDSQRLLRTIRCKRRRTVGANCVRPFLICYELTGDRRSPLRFVVVCAVSFATAFGCLSLTTQLLLFRKNHARLACSVVNALSTAHCRYQLLRIYILLSAVNVIYQRQSNGGSKPPPYTVGYNLSLHTKPQRLRISNSPTRNKAPLSRGAFVI